MRKFNFKFHNPFTPHIVQFPDGKYAVRKWSFYYMRWAYYDSQKVGKDDYWWTLSNSAKWYKLNSLEEARLLLEMLVLRRQIGFSKKGVRVELPTDVR